MPKTLFSLIVAATCTVAAGAAVAQVTPSDVRDLIGARGSSGEGQLASRGYINVAGRQGGDRSLTYWWNETRGVCLTVTTRNGRYDSLISAPAGDCGQGRSDLSPGPPPGGYPTPSGDRFAVEGRPVELGLVCYGEGRKPQLDTRTRWTWNSRTDRYEYGTSTGLRTQDFDASVTLQLWNGGGRIRLPKSLIPPLNSRGVDGWWDLADVDMSRNSIQATYRLNGLNKPRVSIDRNRGRISIVGTSNYGFRGDCDQIDGSDHRRF